MDRIENPTTYKVRRGLGRGLRSLIPTDSSFTDSAGAIPKGLLNLSVGKIVVNPAQPRQHFDSSALAELSSSILEHGVLQPLVVRKTSTEKFEIVAGERRYRAAQLAGLSSVPCVVSDVADSSLLTLALVENIQREDLNILEEAESYRRLLEELQLTQDQVAKAVGKDRSTIANALRLLKLPEKVRAQVVDRKITMGHARALLGLGDEQVMEEVAALIHRDGISVRQTEAMVKNNAIEKKAKKHPLTKKQAESLRDRELRKRFERFFGMRVDLRQNEGKGSLTLKFESQESLDALMERLNIHLN